MFPDSFMINDCKGNNFFPTNDVMIILSSGYGPTGRVYSRHRMCYYTIKYFQFRIHSLNIIYIRVYKIKFRARAFAVLFNNIIKGYEKRNKFVNNFYDNNSHIIITFSILPFR